jgi:uncharacterized membrane protein YGL010W
MLAGKTWEEWIAQYEQSHQHPVNRLCHTIGIPLIATSIPLLGFEFLVFGSWRLFVLLFTVGWVFQFIGHWFEGKPPEFLKDWRFLFVGLRWWWHKVRTSIGSKGDPNASAE